MNRTRLTRYNLQATLMSGQAFVWKERDGWYIGGTIKRAAKLRQEGDILLWQTYPVNDDWEWLSTYLRLDAEYNSIIETIRKDDHMEKAIETFPDLRLLGQSFEESLIGFLCSPMKSIVGIRQCVAMMSERFGDKVDIDGAQVSLFPSIERLAEADLEELLECKVGFRGKNIIGAAKYLVESGLREWIGGYSEQEARIELMNIKGVGDKVADCVLVYGLHYDNIAPLDVWVWRVAREMYSLSESMRYEEVRRWFGEYFDGYASWATQFLFEHIRTTDRKRTANGS